MQSMNKFFTDYEINSHKVKKIRDKYLLISDSGAWAALKQDEYVKLKSHMLNKYLYESLEKKGIIITKNNFSEVADQYRKKNQHLFQGTSLHIVVVSVRCNQVCVYCHAASKHSKKKLFDMSKQTAKKTIEFIFQSTSDAITIEFQGGEPLLNFNIVKYMVNYANQLNKTYKKNLRFSIVTNLTLMDKKKLEFLEKNKVGICTSLDGPEKIHNHNRKYLNKKGSYKKVVEWIKKIQKRKKIGLNALMVTTSYSLNFPEEIFNEYQRLRFNKIWIRYLNNLGFALDAWEKISYSAEDYLTFWKKIVDMSQGKKNIVEIMSTYMLLKILTKTDPMYLDLMSPCGAAIGQLAYQFNGDIYSCDEGRMLGEDVFKLGNVYENKYREVLCSSKTCNLISASVNDNFLCNSCIYQPYCGLCPVNCYAATGNILPRVPHETRCRILKGQFDYLFEKILFDEAFQDLVKTKKLIIKNPFYLD
ncbi:His-Xaa-Ser system radical SAM maturase HxsB [Candidatus Woesearchaeota archaeon]|nr:His-Xaa-Ser system radical SAM maturase HxsB [Candidatus Woesearchaeota archaeon]